MPIIDVKNKSDSIIQIVPIDDAHKAPAPLDQIRATLPPGAFILVNQTASPINAVVVLWSYVDKNGNSQPRSMNCDSYIGGPSDPIVRAKDSTLITPGGCTMREYFAHAAAGKPMLGGDHYAARNRPILDMTDTLTAVHITVDSVIFADGRIWGPDDHLYYKTISANYWAVRSVVEDVSSARAAGQDLKSSLEKIRSETTGKGGQRSFRRKLCADTIHDSPNPEGTLQFYSQQPPLPEFQHIGGGTP
jgi:hypothetical protein